MREIKYRGKRVDNGEWVYGSLLIGNMINKGRCYICEDLTSINFDIENSCCELGGFYEVIPETVGEYTGLNDKNGKKIYEGDVVKANGFAPANQLIEFIEGGFCGTHPDIKGYSIDINRFYPSCGCCIEVIGNIHSNPELLEGN